MVHFAHNSDCVADCWWAPGTACLCFSSHTLWVCQLQWAVSGSQHFISVFTVFTACLQKTSINVFVHGVGSFSDWSGTRFLPFSSFLSKAYVYTKGWIGCLWKSSCSRSQNLFGVYLVHDLWGWNPCSKCKFLPFICKLQSLSASSFFLRREVE